MFKQNQTAWAATFLPSKKQKRARPTVKHILARLAELRTKTDMLFSILIYYDGTGNICSESYDIKTSKWQFGETLVFSNLKEAEKILQGLLEKQEEVK